MVQCKIAEDNTSVHVMPRRYIQSVG